MAIFNLGTSVAALGAALLCVEREQSRCHRGVIAEMVVERNAAIEVLQVL